MKRGIASTGLAIAAALACARTPAPTSEPQAVEGEGAEANAKRQLADDEAWPDEKFRYEPPQPGPTPEVPVPEIDVFVLDGGPKVYLVEQHELPVVSMRLTFDIGSVDDPAGKHGLASLCMDLLDEGTKQRDKIAFEEALADLASNVRSWGGEETSGVMANSLRRNLVPTVDLMVDMLRTPGLRKRDFQRLRERNKASIVQAKAAPSSLSLRLWGSVVYGTDHPYGHVVTEESLDDIRLSDCRRMVRRLGPRGAKLFVYGDVSRRELESELGVMLARWKGKAPRPARIPEPSPRKGTLFFVDVPKAAQSQLFVGHPGPARTAEDYPATEIMSRILGGGFSSRINMNIREDKGYAYGARARFSYQRHGSAFAAVSSVRTDATADALREIAKEIQGIRTEKVSPQELVREKQGTLLSLPARFSTGRRIVSTYGRLVFHGLPLDYYERYQATIERLTEAGVREAAEKHLQADDYKVLVVGDGDVVRDDLEKLAREQVFGSGGMVVLDPDGNTREVVGGESN